MPLGRLVMLVVIVVELAVGAASFVVTRITGHAHFWTGFLQGVGIAGLIIAVIFGIQELFNRRGGIAHG
jgi:VIT1/CCC1 family predicted Fe2+/Mn2+ transporter